MLPAPTIRALVCLLFALLCSLVALPWLASQTPSGQKRLQLVGYIPIPGPKGLRFDYLVIDQEHRRLYATHLGAGKLYEIDLATRRVLRTIDELPGIEGIALVPEGNKAYTSDWKESKIAVIDLAHGIIIKRLPAGAKPDGIAYAAPFHKIYVSDETARAAIVIDTRSDTIVKTLHFKSETGNPRYDPVTRKIYLNLQDTNAIAVIDSDTDTEEAELPAGERCQGNHGMELDPANRLAFLVCEESNTLTVFDLEKRAAIASFAIPDGGDVVAFDPSARKIFVACYSGAISIFVEEDGKKVVKLGDFRTEKKVHSLAIDPTTHLLYVPEQEHADHPSAQIAIYKILP